MYYDIKIFEAINGFAGKSQLLDKIGIFLADYFPYLMVLILVLFLLHKKNNLKNRAMVFIALLSAVIGRYVIKTIIVFFIERPRPYVFLQSAHGLTPINISENFQSFPSGHAIFFFALSMAVYFYNKKLGIFFFICSIIMGVARIFVGVHWPSDILGGLILGIITAFIIQKTYTRISGRG